MPEDTMACSYSNGYYTMQWNQGTFCKDGGQPQGPFRPPKDMPLPVWASDTHGLTPGSVVRCNDGRIYAIKETDNMSGYYAYDVLSNFDETYFVYDTVRDVILDTRWTSKIETYIDPQTAAMQAEVARRVDEQRLDFEHKLREQESKHETLKYDNDVLEQEVHRLSTENQILTSKNVDHDNQINKLKDVDLDSDISTLNVHIEEEKEESHPSLGDTSSIDYVINLDDDE